MHLVWHIKFRNTLNGCQTHSVRAQMQNNKIGRRIYRIFFSLSSDKLCTSKSKGKSNRRNDSCNCDRLHSTLVSFTLGNVNSGAPYFVKAKEHSHRSFREHASITHEQYHEVKVVLNFKKIKLALSRISVTAFHYVAGARRGSITAIYESA